MTIGWPAALIVIVVIIGIVAFLSTVVAGRTEVEREEAKGKYGDQYRQLAADYESLAKETKNVQAAMQSDLAELRSKVESIEGMMREVG